MIFAAPRAAIGGGALLVFATAALGVPGALVPLDPDATQEPPERPGVALAERCALCHAGSPRARAMRDADGRSVAPHDLWRGSVHSASAVDPIWRATLAAELAAAPEHATATAAACMRCHAPLASALGLEDHDTGDVLHALDCEGDLGAAARDGVSCTICHGILPDGLGTESTFDGRFVLDSERRLFGPHPDPVELPMLRRTGFRPVQGMHVSDAALCATCHTLSTETLGPDGTPSGGHFLEQGPYLEWLASDFAAGPEPTSCQDCHLPTRDAAGRPIATALAHNPAGRDFPFLEARAPYGRHEFLGGNTLLLELLAEHAAALGAPGDGVDYERALAATRSQLAQRTAALSLVEERWDAELLELTFEVTNRTGHKLPTGYPARRLFLCIEVFGADGELLFASGRTDALGRLLDADGLVLASELAGGPAAVHVDLVQSASDVAQWRAEALDSDGRPSFRLLRMERFGLDDRLLPAGWDAARPTAAATAPVGVEGDRDFRAGSDRVRVRARLASGARPARVVARLQYQPYAPRWLSELEATATPEARRLTDLLGGSGVPSELVARVDRELNAPR